MELTSSEALRQGIQAHERGQVAKAIKLYRTVLRTHPKHPDANHNMGILVAGVGTLEQSIPYFRVATEVNPSISQYWESYIHTLINLQQFSEADIALSRAQKRGMEGGVFDQFASIINQDKNPSLKQLQPLIDLFERGALSESLKLTNQMLRTFPSSHVLFNIQGASHAGLNQFDEAVTSFQEALEVSPSNVDALNNLGGIRRAQGALESSMQLHRKALKIKHDFPEAYNNLGLAQQDLGNLDEAIDSFNHAIELKQNYVQAHDHLAYALLKKHDINMSIRSYEFAITLTPDDSKRHSNLGVAFFSAGELEKAMSSYAKALTLGQSSRIVYYNMIKPLKIYQMLGHRSAYSLSSMIENDSSKSSCLAASIVEYSLNLGRPSAPKFMHKASKLLASDERNIVRNPDRNAKRVEHNHKLPEKVIALLHFGRSGTGLLHSLIDGHSRILTLPSIYFSEYFDLETWGEIVSGGWLEICDRFMAMHAVLFDARVSNPVPSVGTSMPINLGEKEGMTNVGERRDEFLRVDGQQFRSELNRLLALYDELDALIFFKLVHLAYDKILSGSNDKPIIFYHIHHPYHYAHLNFIRLAPEASWAVMIREPLQSCESWIINAFHNGDYTTLVDRIINMLYAIDSVSFRERRSVGVRLEMLKEYPKETMRALCDWMGVEEEQSLYEMTAQGKKWWGDPSSPDFGKASMTPFGKSSIMRKVGSVFSEHDLFVFGTLFYPFKVSFGYTNENSAKFRADLESIRPMLIRPFDFERKIILNKKLDEKNFVKSGSYQYLRACLIDRWNVLDEFGTYPHMLKPLSLGIPTSHD